MGKSVGSWGALIVAAGATVLLVSAALIAGPHLESQAFPVLADVRFAVVERSNNRMTLDWWGRKPRSCEIVAMTALVRWHGTLIPAELSRGDDASERPVPLPMLTRPATIDQEQRFRRLDVVPDGDAIVLELRHRCHPLWASVTRIPLAVLP